MKKFIFTALILTSFVPISFFASTNDLTGRPGPYYTAYLNAGDGYKQFNGVYDTKEFANPYAGWSVRYKGMWSDPTAYMVNSSGTRRSNTTTLRGLGYYIAGNNSGQIGYKYYTKLKPAFDQVGRDPIELQLNADA